MNVREEILLQLPLPHLTIGVKLNQSDQGWGRFRNANSALQAR
jgi:hypothetical protein